MASFNEINGVPSTGNKWLMTDLLRKDWGFNGFVVTDYTGINEMVAHSIVRNDKEAGELAAKHLLERGCQSVAFIGGKPEDQISARRLDGVLTVLKEHDVLLPREYVKKGESVCDSGYRMTMQILENRRRPDALVCADNYIAYGCVNALHDRGILIPEEMKVITFDDFPFSQILKPMLSVVNIDVYDMGVQAGKYILQKIKRPNLYVQSHITFPTLIIREST